MTTGTMTTALAALAPRPRVVLARQAPLPSVAAHLLQQQQSLGYGGSPRPVATRTSASGPWCRPRGLWPHPPPLPQPLWLPGRRLPCPHPVLPPPCCHHHHHHRPLVAASSVLSAVARLGELVLAPVRASQHLGRPRSQPSHRQFRVASLLLPALPAPPVLPYPPPHRLRSQPHLQGRQRLQQRARGPCRRPQWRPRAMGRPLPPKGGRLW